MSSQHRRGTCPGCLRDGLRLDYRLNHRGCCGRCRARARKGQPLVGELPQKEGPVRDFNGGYREPKTACPYPPWSQEYRDVLAERARAGMALRHRDDCGGIDP